MGNIKGLMIERSFLLQQLALLDRKIMALSNSADEELTGASRERQMDWLASPTTEYEDEIYNDYYDEDGNNGC